MESSEQQLLSSPEAGLQQPQDHLYAKCCFCYPCISCRADWRGEWDSSFYFYTSVFFSHLASKVWNCIKCGSLTAVWIYEQVVTFLFLNIQTTSLLKFKLLYSWLWKHLWLQTWQLGSLILSWNSLLKTRSFRHIHYGNYKDNKVQFSIKYLFFHEISFLIR